MLYINIFSIIYEHKPETDNTADRLGGSVWPQILVTGVLTTVKVRAGQTVIALSLRKNGKK